MDWHDAGDELGVDERSGALDTSRSRYGQGEHGHRLELSSGRRHQAAHRERAPIDSRHAAPESPARPALPGPRGERRSKRESGVEGHGPGSRGIDGRSAGGSIEPRALDATLSHRRAPLGGDDDGIHGAITGDPMRRALAVLLCTSAFTSRAAAQAVSAMSKTTRDFVTVSEPVVALTNATVIDGTGAGPRPGQTIVIRDGRIADVGASASVKVPADARTIDVAGGTVIPGIVGMHDHLFYTAA